MAARLSNRSINHSTSTKGNRRRNGSGDHPKYPRHDSSAIQWVRALRPIIVALILSVAALAARAELVNLASGLELTVSTQGFFGTLRKK